MRPSWVGVVGHRSSTSRLTRTGRPPIGAPGPQPRPSACSPGGDPTDATCSRPDRTHRAHRLPRVAVFFSGSWSPHRTRARSVRSTIRRNARSTKRRDWTKSGRSGHWAPQTTAAIAPGTKITTRPVSGDGPRSPTADRIRAIAKPSTMWSTRTPVDRMHRRTRSWRGQRAAQYSRCGAGHHDRAL